MKGNHLVVGSAKGNIGCAAKSPFSVDSDTARSFPSVGVCYSHLESTAFLASLIKVCLIFEKKVPVNADLVNPNPKI
jgi:hypothetical protein